MQMESTECGAACLCMILAYYGRWESLEKVRSACGVSRDGVKCSTILKAARSYGMDAKGYSYSMEALQETDEIPCILYWEFNHFVVLKGFRGKRAYLNDPARGAITVSMEEFDQCFTGIALMMHPRRAIMRGSRSPRLKALPVC